MLLTQRGTVRKTAKGLTPDERLKFVGWTITHDDCWEWNGGRTVNGYGKVGNTSAHRFAYETWVGPISEGHVVRHKCDNRPCINPEHLETGTHQDNMNDMVARGRSASGERNTTSILTEQDVSDIREEYGRGVLTRQMLAETYGVSKSTIGYVLDGTTWRHLD